MKRIFYKCTHCGFEQEDAADMEVDCDKCGAYDWELSYVQEGEE